MPLSPKRALALSLLLLVGVLVPVAVAGPICEYIPFKGPGPCVGTDPATSVIAGGPSTCAILSTHDLTCWGFGSNDYSGGDVVDASTDTLDTCVVVTSGDVTCWGENSWGESAPYTGGNAVAVAANYHFTCAALSNGNVQCWG